MANSNLATMQQYQLFIDGEWRDPANGNWFETANPYTGTVWAKIPRGGAEDVELAVAAAHRAFKTGDWPALTASRRGQLLVRLADVLVENAEALAAVEVRDNGKLIAEVLHQCRYLAEWYRYYGGLADKIEGTVPPIDKPNVLNFTRHEPLGVCACITPWNSPLLLLAWKAAPALAAGNTLVIKPSEYTSASTLESAVPYRQSIPALSSSSGRVLGEVIGAATEKQRPRRPNRVLCFWVGEVSTITNRIAIQSPIAARPMLEPAGAIHSSPSQIASSGQTIVWLMSRCHCFDSAHSGHLPRTHCPADCLSQRVFFLEHPLLECHDFVIDVVDGLAVALLDLPDQLIALAGDDIHVVIGQFAPLLADGALHLHPVAFNDLLVHLSLLRHVSMV